MNNDKLSNLVSIRQQQAYGAVCLALFAKNYGVFPEAIKALIIHLFSMLKADSLPDWEEEGTQLAISCFGDPLPEDIKKCFPSEIRDLTEEIIDRVSVIGVVDMYGAITGRSLECLSEAAARIKSCGIGLPDIAPLSYEDENGWGNAVNEEKYNKLRDNYDDLLNCYGKGNN